jgi:hypothetical protein
MPNREKNIGFFKDRTYPSSLSKHTDHTVDGRNPAPVYRWFIPLFIGFLLSQVVQDFPTIHSRIFWKQNLG